ncbi:DUF4232 domain-containing protein [Streptomyces sp. ISL-36]|uniref:DUF4232 domain-containing protein n=1 Tax=Streptomyces sp. ISL-36 TaxID=2819182 RepID=UPI001BE532B1|nr:DUF4232 domain-containing protein [Streptomyces sp. ISL-36]MBT2440084.1 DUF4232 domain-containing protein [Streptomyces sp. ISL-36]
MVHIHARSAALVSAGILTLTATPASAATQPSAVQPAPCQTSNLALDWTDSGTAQPGGRDTAGRQVDTIVSMKNTGSRACTLQGYPGVTLKMGTETQGVITETFFPQKSEKPKVVKLNPGATARFTVTFLSGKETDDNIIDPPIVAITPPGNTKAKELRWWWGPVQQQEAATHPGNYVSPVVR